MAILETLVLLERQETQAMLAQPEVLETLEVPLQDLAKHFLVEMAAQEVRLEETVEQAVLVKTVVVVAEIPHLVPMLETQTVEMVVQVRHQAFQDPV